MNFENIPTPVVEEAPDEQFDQPGERVENMDAYEREKIERSLQGAEHLAAVIRNYLAMVDFAREKNIDLPRKPDFGSLRTPGALFDPMREGSLEGMSVVFQNAMHELSKDIPYTHQRELESRMVLNIFGSEPKKDGAEE